MEDTKGNFNTGAEQKRNAQIGRALGEIELAGTPKQLLRLPNDLSTHGPRGFILSTINSSDQLRQLTLTIPPLVQSGTRPVSHNATTGTKGHTSRFSLLSSKPAEERKSLSISSKEIFAVSTMVYVDQKYARKQAVAKTAKVALTLHYQQLSFA